MTAGAFAERGDVESGSPAVAIAAHGAGYWVVTADGRVHTFGVATFGDAANLPLNPVTGIAANATGNGYWIARADGTVNANGTLTVNGAPHPTPSAAASTVKDGGAANGWDFWAVEDTSGRTSLATLRARYADGQDPVNGTP